MAIKHDTSSGVKRVGQEMRFLGNTSSLRGTAQPVLQAKLRPLADHPTGRAMNTCVLTQSERLVLAGHKFLITEFSFDSSFR